MQDGSLYGCFSGVFEMKVTIELVIETDEAEAEELAMAVKTALNILEMPNGDSLYLGDQIVVVKDVSA